MDESIPIERLLYEAESSTLDFKQEGFSLTNQPDHIKAEMLKDILAFANAWRGSDAYILLGVKEVAGGRAEIIGIGDNDLDDAQLQQFVNGKTQKKIEFSYRVVLIEDKKVGVVKIPVQERPFFSTKNFAHVQKNLVYLRSGSSTDVAGPEEIYAMGKESSQTSVVLPDVSVEFADRNKRKLIGKETAFDTVYLEVPDMRDIPDFNPRRIDDTFPGLSMMSSYSAFSPSPRESYYRELVEHYFIKLSTQQIEFAVQNKSQMPLNDLHAQLIVRVPNSEVFLSEDDPVPEVPDSHRDLISTLHVQQREFKYYSQKDIPQINVEQLDDSFHIDLYFGKVKPQETIYLNDAVYFTVIKSVALDIEIKLFADEIATPLISTLNLKINVTNKPGSLEDILELHDQGCVT